MEINNGYAFAFEEHPAKKGKCPACGYNGEFRHYKGQPREFGKCERVNNCGYHNKPAVKQDFYSNPAIEEGKILYPKNNLVLRTGNNSSSRLHGFLQKSGIPLAHLEKHGMGTDIDDDDRTCFIYRDVAGRPINIKSVLYNENGRRTKDIRYLPQIMASIKLLFMEYI
ncbi:MAG TPA: hypothetical protein VD908_07800 [Cytophagales bacterium]|nr:hypothetical protein [Cytophagales bacterium]